MDNQGIEAYPNLGFEDDVLPSNSNPQLQQQQQQKKEQPQQATVEIKRVVVEDDQDEERATWGNKCDFFLSALGYAVGLGNVWRFPYLAYKNGGGSFLIPYTIMLVFTGLPLFFMELALGQYSGCGPTRLFGRMAPIFKGLGFSMICVTFFVAIYYNVIIGWTLFYMFAGFSSELPWSQCGNYSSPRCHANGTEGWTPPEDYFNHVMLGLDPYYHDWSHFGSLRWQLVLCLLAAWIVVCLSLIKGVQSSGKVVYFTAIFPFVVLIILFGVGVTLKGAADGVLFYVTPDFEKLKELEVWKDAANQIFYSLGPTFGGLITLSSYNKFDNNCHRDAVLIALCNCGTSVFAGFVVFSILGFMADNAGVTVPEVVKSGPALAFIAYPDAVGSMSVPQLWSFLFFFMFVTLGLDSMFTFVETLTTAILDHFRSLRVYKEWVVAITCLVGFLCGLSMCTEGGIYMFTLIDSMSASWNILLFALIEVVLVAWVYGTDKFLGNISEMGIKLPTVIMWYWKICWQFITPGILAVLVIMSFYFHSPVVYGDYEFEPSVQALGWMIGFSSFLFIPGVAAWNIYKRSQRGKPLGMAVFKPTPKWGPASGAPMGTSMDKLDA